MSLLSNRLIVYEVGLVKRLTNKWQQLILSRVDQEKREEEGERERERGYKYETELLRSTE